MNAAAKVYVWDDRRYAGFAGQISGRAVAFNPLLTGNLLNTLLLPNLQISDGLGAVTYTDSLGNYTFTTPSAANVPVGLTGRWGMIQDQNNTPLLVTLTNGAQNPVNLLFNPSGNLETDVAQVNAYIHENEVHDYIKAHGVNPLGIDSVLPIQVNKRDICNSHYDGNSINFFKSGGGCLNSAYDTLIFHEYGHFIDDSIGGITDGALSEGWGDIMAMFVSGQPAMGEGFFGTPSSFIRNGVNNYIYHAGDEVHTEGQAWMGFAWDLRTNLIAALGQAQGVALAESLVLPVFWANSHDIPSAVREVAVRDSPDSDPTHGPHFTQIIAAAGHHGLGFAIVPTPPSITISSPANNSAVSGMVNNFRNGVRQSESCKRND